MEEGRLKSKRLSYTPSSNVKLFDVQRRMETAKPLQFLELMKAMFDCGGNWVDSMDNDSVMSEDGESDE
jgi:hypothetical protein